MAERGLAKVALSVTTLDPKLARALEPRAATPARRLEAIRQLAEAGIPTTVMVAPVIPAINDMEIERILDAAHAAGAREAGYVLLRLPLEISGLMREWLAEHHPDKLNHVFSLMQSTRGGKDYDSRWGLRMTGTGPYAWMIGRRFEMAAARLGLNRQRLKLRTDLFVRPRERGRAARAVLSLEAKAAAAHTPIHCRAAKAAMTRTTNTQPAMAILLPAALRRAAARGGRLIGACGRPPARRRRAWLPANSLTGVSEAEAQKELPESAFSASLR